MHSIDYGVAPNSSSSRQCPLLPDCNGDHHPNLFFRCLSAAAATGLKNAFVIVQISRFQQVIGVYTLQAQTEALKVRTLSRSGGCYQGQIVFKVKSYSYLNCSQGQVVVKAGKVFSRLVFSTSNRDHGSIALKVGTLSRSGRSHGEGVLEVNSLWRAERCKDQNRLKGRMTFLGHDVFKVRMT